MPGALAEPPPPLEQQDADSESCISPAYVIGLILQLLNPAARTPNTEPTEPRGESGSGLGETQGREGGAREESDEEEPSDDARVKAGCLLWDLSSDPRICEIM